MIRILLFLVTSFFISLYAVAQRTCATMENYQYQLQNNPNLGKNLEVIEQQTTNYIKARLANKNAKIEETVITIPVVVHVVYNAAVPQENISDAQIQSQIDALNEDYNMLNADASKVPADFQGLKSNIQIKFALATVDPDGKATTGIDRKSTNKASWGTKDDVKKLTKGGVNPWNASKYLNFWVANIGGGILGYAQFPGGSAATDGVVISPQYFGRTGYVSAPYNKGRTATHEVGHWLNLRHIWGDETACAQDDLVNDTPLQKAENYGTPTYPQTTQSGGRCNGLDPSSMFMNYMDYVDDAAMFMFSTGQKDRVRALFVPGGARESLLADVVPAPDPGICAVPTNSNASNIAQTTFTIGWAAVQGALSYDLNIRVLGSVTWTTLNNATASINLQGAVANTTYEYQVRTNCTNGSSAYSAIQQLKTLGAGVAYCASKGVTTYEWIQRVTIGGIDNNSGNNNGYGDFTALSANVSIGKSTNITIYPGWAGTSYTEGYRVWIDYNQDGDFADAGEQVVSVAKTKTTPVVSNFIAPASAKVGSTRMRVSMKYNANPTMCEAIPDGEVEDYTVVIGNNAKEMAQIDTETASRQQLSLYPNPAKDVVNVSLIVEGEQEIVITLSDLQGRILTSANVRSSQGNVAHQLDVSKLQRGIYLVSIKTGNQTMMKKLIVSQ